MLDKRLKAIADLVRKDAYVCDVGTDHAYIPCYLIKEGITSRCIACDINEHPLKSADRHIHEYGLSDKIETVISNGLQNIPQNKAEDIIIAGMGGELISQILSACDYVKSTDKRLILQPMTQTPFLRKYLYNEGYNIIEEVPVVEGSRVYTVIYVKYSGTCQEVDEFFSILGKIPNSKTPDALEYVKRQQKRISKIADGLGKSVELGEQEEHYRKLENQIKKEIQKMQLQRNN